MPYTMGQAGVEATAIAMGTFMSGILMGLSTMTMPALIQSTTSSSQLLSQWKAVFDRGHFQGPGLAISTLSVYTYAAWLRLGNGQDCIPFVVGGAMTLGIVPYTIVFMGEVNRSLFAAVEGSRKGKGEMEKREVDALVGKWTRLHTVRCLMPLIGAVVAGFGLLRSGRV